MIFNKKNIFIKILIIFLFFLIFSSQYLSAQESKKQLFYKYSYVSKGNICLSLFLGNLFFFDFGFGIDYIFLDIEEKSIFTNSGFSFKLLIYNSPNNKNYKDLILSSFFSIYIGLLRGIENSLSLGLSFVLPGINNNNFLFQNNFYLGTYLSYCYKIYLINRLAIFIETFSIFLLNLNELMIYANINIGIVFVI